MKGDLHCHTKLSDGSESVEEVILMAKKMGLDTLAITDHDTIASFAYSKELGEKHGITVIPGVELSCIDNQRGRKVHMLCYLPEYPERLEEHCVRTCKARAEVGLKMAEAVTKYYPITVEDVVVHARESTSVYKQHIMHALMSHGYTTHIFSEIFYDLFHSKTGKVYANVPYPDVYDMLALIREAGGIAVLAHPYEYNSVDLLKELAEAKAIDGVEVYHSRCPKEKEGALIEIAQKHHLIMTGGSDFHGFYASRPSPIGNRYTAEESLKALFALQK